MLLMLAGAGHASVVAAGPRNDRIVYRELRRRLKATNFFDEVMQARVLPDAKDTNKWASWAAILPEQSWDKEDGSFQTITHRANYRLVINVNGEKTSGQAWDKLDRAMDAAANVLMAAGTRDYADFCIPHLTTLREDYRSAGEGWIRGSMLGGFGYTLNMDDGMRSTVL